MRDKLIIENLPLAYFFANKFKNNEVDDLAIIGLIKGIDNYNNKKGDMKSYLYKCILNEIYYSHRVDKNPKNTVSLSQPVDINITVEDTLGEENTIENDLIIKTEFDKVMKKLNGLNDMEQEFIKLNFGINCDRMSQKDIAKLYNVSQIYVCKKINRAIEKLKRRCKNG